MTRRYRKQKGGNFSRAMQKKGGLYIPKRRYMQRGGFWNLGQPDKYAANMRGRGGIFFLWILFF